jgi:hypothetical protein
MNGPGRPTLYRPEYVEQAHDYCLLGATNDELAGYFGVAPRSVDCWLQAHPEFARAVRNGRDVADAQIARRLQQRAMGYDYVTKKIVVCRGESVKVDHTVHIPPDVQAGIFWLRNRRRKQWRERAKPEPASGLTLAELEEVSARARREFLGRMVPRNSTLAAKARGMPARLPARLIDGSPAVTAVTAVTALTPCRSGNRHRVERRLVERELALAGPARAAGNAAGLQRAGDLGGVGFEREDAADRQAAVRLAKEQAMRARQIQSQHQLEQGIEPALRGLLLTERRHGANEEMGRGIPIAAHRGEGELADDVALPLSPIAPAMPPTRFIERDHLRRRASLLARRRRVRRPRLSGCPQAPEMDEHLTEIADVERLAAERATFQPVELAADDRGVARGADTEIKTIPPFALGHRLPSQQLRDRTHSVLHSNTAETRQLLAGKTTQDAGRGDVAIQ